MRAAAVALDLAMGAPVAWVAWRWGAEVALLALFAVAVVADMFQPRS